MQFFYIHIVTINTIGYDWKSFNMGTFSYNLQDYLCYFIKDDLDNIWKLQLTGFDGSSTGGIFFNTEKLLSSNFNENIDVTFLHIFILTPLRMDISLSLMI